MKKVLIVIIIFLSFIIDVKALTGYAYCPDNPDAINIRKEQNTISEIIGTIQCGETVDILNENTGSNWYQIKYNNKIGYAIKDFIKLNKTSEEDGKVICIEDTSPLQMYSDLNRKNKISGGALSCDTKVKILDKNAGEDGKGICPTSLYKIRYQNLEGYVCGKYIGKDTSNINMDTTDLKEYRENLKKLGFPESYLDDLVKIHIEYPNWQFMPFNTKLDWNTVIENESVKNRNLIWYSYGEGYRSKESYSYNYATDPVLRRRAKFARLRFQG